MNGRVLRFLLLVWLPSHAGRWVCSQPMMLKQHKMVIWGLALILGSDFHGLCNGLTPLSLAWSGYPDPLSHFLYFFSFCLFIFWDPPPWAAVGPWWVSSVQGGCAACVSVCSVQMEDCSEILCVGGLFVMFFYSPPFFLQLKLMCSLAFQICRLPFYEIHWIEPV